MGTPDFAVPALHAVAQACDVVAVVTQPDRPSGRGRHAAASAVAGVAEQLGLPLLKPERPNHADTLEGLRALDPDLFAVVAYGAILSRGLLAVPRLGAINLHGSLLPDHRGASPVQRALWEGNASTGVTTLWMDEGIDTGDLILQRWVAIEPTDTAGTLARRLAEAGAPLLAESLALAHAGKAPRRHQDGAAGSYAKKLTKADGVVRWDLAADAVWNRQRAVTPWPGAVTAFGGRPLKLIDTRPEHRLPLDAPPGEVLAVERDGVVVACAPGALRVTRVRPEARAEMEASAWARGARVTPGDRLATDRGPLEAHA